MNSKPEFDSEFSTEKVLHNGFTDTKNVQLQY